MDYLAELNAFMDWVMINRPSTGQVALWYSLMMIYQKTNFQDWFTVPNQTLQIMTGLSRQGLEKARCSLAQKSRIEYRKGSSNQAGRYHLVVFDCQKVGTVVVTAGGTEVGTGGAQQEAQETPGELFASTGSSVPAEKKEAPKVASKTIIYLFNNICLSLPKVRLVTDKRDKTIKARLKKFPDVITYETVFKKAEASDFLSGRNGKWSACSFDWLLNESNMVKVLEGNYDNDRQQGNQGSPPAKKPTEDELKMQAWINEGRGGPNG